MAPVRRRKSVRSRPLAAVGLVLITGCPAEVALPVIDVGDDVARLQNRTVFFGHQSVGADILLGLAELDATPIASKVVTVGLASPGTVGHARVGVNGDPAQKIDDFAARLRGLESGVDVAVVKLCYADFEDEIDLDALFARYRTTMQALADEFPATRFAHFTVPLTTVESGPKALVKSLLGKPLYGIAQNARRERYNQRLREAFGDEGHLFDLARIASTHPDGATERADDGGLALVPAFTDDGGHLNATGRRVVGASFVKFLARLPPPTAKADE